MAHYHRLVQSIDADSPVSRLRGLVNEMSNLLGPNHLERLLDHSAQVSRLAWKIGAKMNLPLSFVRNLKVAGLCHELEVLLLPERLISTEKRECHDRSFTKLTVTESEEMALA